MDPSTAYMVTNMGGAGLSSHFSRENAREANEYTNWLAQRRWQYQANDMRAAGLNPILGLTGGSPSTGSAHMAQAPDFAQALTSGMSAGKMASEIGLVEKQIQHEAEKIGLTKEQTTRVADEINKMRSEVERNLMQAYNIDLENITKERATEYLTSNEWLIKAEAISKSLGIEVRDLTKMVNVGLFKNLAQIFGSARAPHQPTSGKGN